MFDTLTSMSRVHLVPFGSKPLAVDPAPERVVNRLRESQAADRFGVHTLTDDPAEADLILFVRTLTEGMLFSGLLGHPLVRR